MPTLLLCACGNKSVMKRNSDYICQRCLDLELAQRYTLKKERAPRIVVKNSNRIGKCIVTKKKKDDGISIAREILKGIEFYGI